MLEIESFEMLIKIFIFYVVFGLGGSYLMDKLGQRPASKMALAISTFGFITTIVLMAKGVMGCF